jgi:hypothetical protein
MHPALTYSLLTLMGAIFAAGWWIDGRPEGHRVAPMRKFSLVMQLGALIGAFLVLRPGHGTHDSANGFEAAIGHGTPALIDVYSNA